jgi:hypothetical protein
MWYSLRTKYLVLRYQSTDDLKAFDKKIEFAADSSSFSGFLSGNSSNKNFRTKMASRLDALVEKVQLILDMRKPIKINVKIFPDKSSLHQEYFNIYKKRGKLCAWYIYENNTIYVSVDDVFAGMFAHECAHAIIDHFLAARPPRATAEILARYVDSHLNKKAKVY